MKSSNYPTASAGHSLNDARGMQWRHIVVYATALAILILTLKWLEWRFLAVEHSHEIYIGLIALFFTVLGFWIANQQVKQHTTAAQIQSPVAIDEAALQKLGLSSREYEVLQLLAKGFSNADIAANLHLSLSTVKTHASGVFRKMDVKSRTQAIEKARRIKVIV